MHERHRKYSAYISSRISGLRELTESADLFPCSGKMGCARFWGALPTTSTYFSKSDQVESFLLLTKICWLEYHSGTVILRVTQHNLTEDAGYFKLERVLWLLCMKNRCDRIGTLLGLITRIWERSGNKMFLSRRLRKIFLILPLQMNFNMRENMIYVIVQNEQ